jgi:hypothetical protein
MSASQYTTHLRDAFFSRETVVASVKQCVKSLSYYTDDPLVSFANVAIQKPLSFTVTTQGLCPFEDNVRIIIPYAAMSAAQLGVTRRLMDVGSERCEFLNCSHQNGDFSVTAVCDRRAVHVDPCLVIFGIFSLVRSAARVWNLNAQTILSVMQQHIISTLCLHQHQLQAAWQLMRETEGGGGAQTARIAAAASSDISQSHI